MDPITITHKDSGAKAVVHPFGATIVSFCPQNRDDDVLFVSKLAKRDGSKAIRGGVPLAFPQFGQPDKSMPQHGFLRNNWWKVGKSYDEDDSSSSCQEFHLSLKDVVNGRGGLWEKDTTKYDCEITLLVKVQATKLTTILSISNVGTTSFDFQALFHTYYKVKGGQALNKNICNVTGLGGYAAEDKITSDKYTIESNDTAIFVDREVDRIYTPPIDKPILNVTVCTSATAKTNITAMASLHGGSTTTTVPVSVVVWNPHVTKSKGMGDFDDEEYHDMICVEPGILSNVPSLEPGTKGIFEQAISAL